MEINRTKSRKIPLVKAILIISISLVWLINGLYCKLLDFVPRHEEIVARILGPQHASLFTKLIGVSEILMFIWIISRKSSRFCVIVQVILIAVMNTIEFFSAPDLLLFGKINSLVALFFIAVIVCTEFYPDIKLK